MKLSIIVPVYNVKPFLEACVGSLLAQGPEDYEIILVDDGATDGSGEMVTDYAQKYPGRVKALHVSNGGQGRARNFGIEIAQGEYIGFVDSDDWVEPEMYGRLLGRAEETGAELVYCDFMGRYSDGRTEYLPAVLQENKMSAAGSSCNKIFKRELIGDVRFPVGLWYEDFAFSAMMLMRAEKIEYVREPLYDYRCGQESTMHNNNARKNLDIITILDGIREHMDREENRDDFEFLVINHLLLDTINRVAKQNSPDRAETLRTLRRYARENIPSLRDCESFKKESANRRVIMFLNYHGLFGLSRFILRVRALLKK